MKSVIIDRLIEIEDSARSISKETQGKELNLPVMVHEKCDEIEKQLKENYEEKAKKIKEQKEQEAKQKTEEIEKDSTNRYKRLEEFYESNHKQWEDEIFNLIIGR